MKLMLWMKGLLIKRNKKLWGITLGVAVTVSLIMSLGVFILSSSATMTKRAIQDVPLDWQILLSQSTDASAVSQAVQKTTRYSAYAKVGYADTTGFTANTAGTTQTTGPGKALGIPDNYKSQFPGELRHLIGSMKGVLLAQQTAANLHATVGDNITIQRKGLQPVQVKVDGIVDLPNADSLFQAVGVPKGTAPQAPPDNVVLLPMHQWQTIFQPQAKIRPDSVRTELHFNITHSLPGNPNKAYKQVVGMGKHVEALIAGKGVVANNLAARIDGVRGDALYAKVLFLFLGLPGAVLAILLTWVIASSGSAQRRKEQALLRVRGASTAELIRFAAAEAGLIGGSGIILGLLLTYLTGRFMFASSLFFNVSGWIWLIASMLIGLLLSLFSVVFPAWQDAKQSTVAAAKLTVGRSQDAMWKRTYMDILLLLLSIFSYWRLTKNGYQLVLAPEGVAKTSVHYDAFIAPFCLWLGGTLFLVRLIDLFLRKGKRILTVLFKPVSLNLSHVVVSFLSRQRKRIILGVLMVALAFSFASSTSIFNLTYHAQSLVDAQLTNGADVTVAASTFTDVGRKLSQIKRLPDVKSAQPVQHRFAFVGNDLQDIYGIDPKHITKATQLSNSYFYKSTVKQTMKKLAQTPDGVLVSAETARDYQLQMGDQLNLRLQSAKDHQYHTIRFHFIGIVSKFPTAPKDSFLVANSRYIAKQTGSNAAEIMLIAAKQHPAQLAKKVTKIVSGLPGAQVSDIASTRQTIRSSLTAVDLHGLTRLELCYAILFAAGSAGLILALGFIERQRIYTLLSAIGANPKQTASFIWSEGLMILIHGAIAGLVLGLMMSQMLIKVLKGVFDPPPDMLHIPWMYLLILVVSGIVSTLLAVWSAKTQSRKDVAQSLRAL